MIKEDLVGGLKIALSKGQSLQDAMQSFYNAGYPREQIEAAARTLKDEQTQIQPFQPAQTPSQIKPLLQAKPFIKPIPQNKPTQAEEAPPTAPEQPAQQKLSQSQATQQTQLAQPPKQTYNLPVYTPPPQFAMKQVVSNYDQAKEKRIDFIGILLVSILVVLLGILAGVFFYRDQLVEFLNQYLD